MVTGRILVTGATGQLGRRVAHELVQAGQTVRVLTRQRPAHPDARYEWAEGNYVNGDGLAQAFEGVNEVLHLAHDPQHPERDLTGVARLHSFGLAAGIRHFTQVGIVGAAQVPGFPYYAAKAQAEDLLLKSGLHASIFQATQFHSFVYPLLARLERFPVLLVPTGVLQPVDIDEVAAALSRHVIKRQPITERFAGPEVLTIAELAEQLLMAKHRPKPVVSISLPLATLQAVRKGVLTAPQMALGQRTFAEWLRLET